MKKIALLLLLFPVILIAQKKKSTKMGKTTLDELKMTVYDKDSTATAVVLYEHANRYPDNTSNDSPRTDHYYRIKILKKSSFNLSNITINLFKDQKVKDIKGITYNLTSVGTMNKTYLSENNIFSTKENKSWKSKKFTLPNIKEGSVIEYSYSVISPYLSINDWYFQSHIPKIKSEYDASILGNYKYNIKKIGYLNLDKNKPSVDKKCVYIPRYGDGACATYSFGMNDIPAFKEEDYMLSSRNYISRITFDLKSRTSYRGVVDDYTTTWSKADKSLKFYFFNNQTSKKSFFKKNLPENILFIPDDLEKAKKVYQFIQNHFTWNKQNWSNKDNKVKKAFQEKVGAVGEINLSLYNSLKAANLDANLVVLSTRAHGIPTKLFPVIYDFNYVIVKTVINGKEYFLDATSKYLPFGQVPIRTLNGEARVIDFKKKSYWTTLKSKVKSAKKITTKLKLNEEGIFSGNLMIAKTGYFAANQREILALKSEENYLESFEEDHIDLSVEDYNVKNQNELDKSLIQIFKINVEMNEDLGNKIRINPFLFDRITENPFKLKERNYPVDYAYTRRHNYYLNLEIPENYNIVKVPENKAISLPNKGGSFILKVVKKGNVLSLYVRLNILKKVYSTEEYYALKEFYKQIIISENQYLVLEKKE